MEGTKMSMKLKDIDIKGVTVPIEVLDNGHFSADLGEHGKVRAETYDQLVEKLTRALAAKKVSVSIPVIFRLNGAVARGAFTGLHAATGNMLLKIDGKKGGEQIGRWNSTAYLPLKCEEEYEKLVLAKEEADKAVSDFEKLHQLNIDKLLRESLAKVTA